MPRTGLLELLQCTLSAEAQQELLQQYLSPDDLFWGHVQEPSRRVSDKVLLGRLAAVALIHCEDRFIKAAATVNLFYREIEKEWCDVVDADALPVVAGQVRSLLQPADGFNDCRWFLSLLLAESAYWMSRDQFDQAGRVLQKAEPVQELAFGHGQLCTNVVKALLLRLVAATHDGYHSDNRDELIAAADRTLLMAHRLPQNYVFSNEYAFEEVAYVYTMLRQIYNWRRLNTENTAGLAVLEQDGFAWRCVGQPFGAFATGDR